MSEGQVPSEALGTIDAMPLPGFWGVPAMPGVALIAARLLQSLSPSSLHLLCVSLTNKILVIGFRAHWITQDDLISRYLITSAKTLLK